MSPKNGIAIYVASRSPLMRVISRIGRKSVDDDNDYETLPNTMKEGGLCIRFGILVWLTFTIVVGHDCSRHQQSSKACHIKTSLIISFEFTALGFDPMTLLAPQ
ncbi:hypothetical protein IFM89_020656 [Coptis chinensis]|uniref:Uncharacterized protein n=1 Tax=Coptis chinensis TaxID=261450 RepID=A0A835IE77_9MAGN|nr:hypothetical protein IFM89_020656 [Coptis chinensis]